MTIAQSVGIEECIPLAATLYQLKTPFSPATTTCNSIQMTYSSITIELDPWQQWQQH